MAAIPATGKMLRPPDDMMRKPDRNHPVKVNPFEGTVTVAINGKEVARSEQALALNEADFRTILYLPRNDVDTSAMTRSERVTFCPFKGDAVHYTFTVEGVEEPAVAWSYEEPYPALDTIAGYVAFYPNRAAVTSDPPLDE